MKSLWSKLGQAHHCRCNACKTAFHGAGRRVTAAPRRKVTFAEMFTAGYSSMFASAAILDAVDKQERREELDRQLEIARRELAQIRQSNEIMARDIDMDADMSIESSIRPLSEHQADQVWGSIKRIYDKRPYYKEIHQKALLSESKLRETLQLEHYNSSDITSEEASRQWGLDRLLQANLHEEEDPEMPTRDPVKDTHLERSSESVAGLVRTLLNRAKRKCKHPSPSPSYDQALELLEEGYPHYTFPHVDPQRAFEGRLQLNRANRSAMKDSDLGLKEKVGRICYNLLISRYPPNMQTFNGLILGLHQDTHLMRMAQAFVFTHFYDSKMLPTPVTYAAILRHYRLDHNHGQFIRVLRCLAGSEERTGAKYKRVHLDRLEGPDAIRWASMAHKRKVGENYVWEIAPLNKLMMEEIIRGLLQYHMFDYAIDVLSSCIQSRVYLTSELVKQTLDECLAALDWAGCVKLLRELVNHQSLWDLILQTRDHATVAHITDRVYSILDMLGLGTSDRSVSQERLAGLGVSEEGVSSLKSRLEQTNTALPNALVVRVERGASGMSPSERASRSRLLQMESIDKELIRWRKRMRSLDSKALKIPLGLEFVSAMNGPSCMLALENSRLLEQEILGSSEALRERVERGKEREKHLAAIERTMRRSLRSNDIPAADVDEHMDEPALGWGPLPAQEDGNRSSRLPFPYEGPYPAFT